MIEVIKTATDVVTFSRQLIAEGANFHPDDDFTTYVHISTGAFSYAPDEAEIRNRLMSQAFKVCKHEGIDIYNLTMEVYLKETGLDKFIPLPSAAQ